MPEPRTSDAPQNVAVPISQYSMGDLADLYNRARVDYIVPMPMNAKRMEEYIQAYDISLTHSLVALDAEDQHANGLSMLGLRGGRAWITRLGVLPERRRRHTAEFLLHEHLQAAQQLGCYLVQLEVIEGNDAAHRLFVKLGFVETRHLLIVRRPPAALPPELMPPPIQETLLLEQADAVLSLLEQRDDQPTWVEETRSLHNVGKLQALWLRLVDGQEGWLAFQRTPFQLTHFVFGPASPTLRRALLAQLYNLYPRMDTKIENIPADSPAWPDYQAFGYVEAFRRTEMVLQLECP